MAEREKRQMPQLTLFEHIFTHLLKSKNHQLRLTSDQKALRQYFSHTVSAHSQLSRLLTLTIMFLIMYLCGGMQICVCMERFQPSYFS